MEKDHFLGKIGDYEEPSAPTKKMQEDHWLIALGLQDVDGKRIPSEILDILKEYNIEGKMPTSELIEYLKQYYINQKDHNQKQKECDLVATRIVELLGEEAFSFSPLSLKNIHAYLFQDLYDFAGQYRKKNIISRESILDGDYVMFTPHYEIEATLAYEFNEEASFSYNNLTIDEKIEHIAKFVSNIWQIHPFEEGNTRTVAVFIQKYLRALGFNVNNESFKEHSLYLRNAFVRSQYSNIDQGIYRSDEGLLKFFENLLLNTHHYLDNEDLIPSTIYEKVYMKK